MAETFNYISFGNRDAIPEGDGRISMSRGRMFEYTPDAVAAALQGLSDNALRYLEKLPTFLCSEIDRREQGAAVRVKYGRLSEVSLKDGAVGAQFTQDIDFGDVLFPDPEVAREVLQAGSWQLYRTHWAVREGDTQAILNALAQRLPEPQPDRVPAVELPAEPPQAPERQTLGEATSVEGFLNLLFQSKSSSALETFFRGHDDAAYELTPSLFRKKDDGGWRYLPNEDRLCKELLIAHHDEFQSDQYCFDRLVRMQHFDLPTRLLDISGNPLVALYFACTGSKGLQEDLSGEVIVFRVASDQIKYYDSDTVSCLANLCQLTHEQKNALKLDLSFEDFKVDETVGKLLHFIKAEKPFFENRIEPSHLGSILCVKAKQTNLRIRSQSGAFLLFGHDVRMSETGQDGIEIDRITITNKAEILRQLDRLNINAKTVYPSIDRTAQHLKQRYEVITQAGPTGVSQDSP
jgi:hypothetical protein